MRLAYGFRAAALLLLLSAPLAAQTVGPDVHPPSPASDEQVVAGLSEHEIAITANFSGSNILVYGAVKREMPIPPGPPLQVVMTLQGPSARVIVRKKDHEYGIWVNTESVRISRAPSFYAIATSAPLGQVLSQTDDLRYHISIPRAIYDIGIAGMAPDPRAFVDAMVRIRKQQGLYVLDEGTVKLDDSTLFSTRIALPSNLTEGNYTLRIFLTREGKVLSHYQSSILVQKTGLERWLYHLALQQSAIYGLLSLAIAIAAGWLASTAFRMLKR